MITMCYRDSARTKSRLLQSGQCAGWRSNRMRMAYHLSVFTVGTFQLIRELFVSGLLHELSRWGSPSSSAAGASGLMEIKGAAEAKAKEMPWIKRERRESRSPCQCDCFAVRVLPSQGRFVKITEQRAAEACGQCRPLHVRQD